MQCPVCLADTVFVDPYSDESRGYLAVPLPPKDVLSAADSGMINVDDGDYSALSNDHDAITSVLLTDVKGGGDAGNKIDFSTMCYVVLLVIISVNAIVCSWHVMKAERKDSIMGYFAGSKITAKVTETDCSDSDSEMEEEDYYDREDDDEYRTSSDLDGNFSDNE